MSESAFYYSGTTKLIQGYIQNLLLNIVILQVPPPQSSVLHQTVNREKSPSKVSVSNTFPSHRCVEEPAQKSENRFLGRCNHPSPRKNDLFFYAAWYAPFLLSVSPWRNTELLAARNQRRSDASSFIIAHRFISVKRFEFDTKGLQERFYVL